MTRAFIALLMLHSALWFTNTVALAQEGAWSSMPITATYHSAVEVTPWGVLAGAKEGLYETKDLGNTWKYIGLQNRLVTDVKWYGDSIYASTYYWLQDQVGLFVSTDKGVSWTHIGNKFSTSQVDRDSQTIYLGGYSHGLWISQDNGITWEQKIGTGWFGPEVKAIESTEEATFVSIGNTTYKTTDHGQTWNEVTFLKDKGVLFLTADNQNVLASSNAPDGYLYISKDLGNTWDTVQSLGMRKTSAGVFFNDVIFIGAEKPQGTSTVLYSTDLGNSWHETGLVLPSYSACKSISGLTSDPNVLFAAIAPMGFYRYKIPNLKTAEPFLSTPWTMLQSSDLIKKVYSFFDHEYPLLAYPYYPEPATYQSTTLNFLGIKGYEPDMYYSSHDGIDFALPYGTEIKAPFSGIATYYYCKDCGHTIKIDHRNGYQTVYMHLQKDGLTVSGLGSIEVNEGDVLGKVGLTGRTTGPHLHFAVIKDKNNNGSFSDDYPDGRVDPFGWDAGGKLDPWENLMWNDSTGLHNGSTSISLWKNPPEKTSTYTVKGLSQIALENLRVSVSPLDEEKGFTSIAQLYSIPKLPSIQNSLEYIETTSFILNAFDHLGEPVTQFTLPATILVSLVNADFTNAVAETVKLYFWNESTKLWEALPTILNLEHNYLISETTHFSRFAAFAEKMSNDIPQTTILVKGSQNTEGTYTEYPVISFTTDLPSHTYFSLGESNWKEYLEPFTLDQSGSTQISFQSVSEYGVWGEVRTTDITVESLKNYLDINRITGAMFSVNFQ